jgi:DNA-binding CsgD family transcriptional regulator
MSCRAFGRQAGGDGEPPGAASKGRKGQGAGVSTDASTAATDAVITESNIGGNRFRADLLGYSLHLCWICLTFYQVVPNALGQMYTVTSPGNLTYLSSTLALCFTLCLGIARTKPFMRIAESAPGVWGAPAITCLGTVLFCANALSPHVVTAVAGGILTGIGSAVMAARWASVFGAAGTRPLIETFSTLLVVTAIVCMTTSYLPLAAILSIMTALPLASGACLQHARRVQSSMRDGRGAAEPPASRRGRAAHRRGMFGALAAFIALVGLASGALPQLSRAPEALPYDLVFYLLTALFALAFIGILLYQESPRALLVALALPLGMLLVVTIPFARFVSASPLDPFYLIGEAAFELLLMFFAVLFALVLDLSPARTFMASRVTLALSDIVGSLFGARLVSLAASEALGSAYFLQVASIVALVAAELVTIGMVGGYLVLHRRSGILGGEPGSAAKVEVGGPRDDAAAASPSTAGHPTANVAGDDARSAGAGGEEAEADSPIELSHRVAGQYHLSPRETDVLELLAQGDAPAQIQEKLCISQGTMSYHMRNIYAKLGVHSRQELMVLVLSEARADR